MTMTRFKDDDKIIDITKLRKKQTKKADDESSGAKLYDVADMIVKLSIALDSLGHTKYGDMLSKVIEEMFTDASLSPEDWGWEEDSE